MNFRRSNPKPRRSIGIRHWRVPIPASRIARIALGVALLVGGLLGFLPILGFWMIPLGLMVLSIDLVPVRRLRRRIESWWGRRARREKSR